MTLYSMTSGQGSRSKVIWPVKMRLWRRGTVRSMDDLVWLCTPWPRVRGQSQRSYDLSKWLMTPWNSPYYTTLEISRKRCQIYGWTRGALEASKIKVIDNGKNYYVGPMGWLWEVKSQGHKQVIAVGMWGYTPLGLTGVLVLVVVLFYSWTYFLTYYAKCKRVHKSASCNSLCTNYTKAARVNSSVALIILPDGCQCYLPNFASDFLVIVARTKIRLISISFSSLIMIFVLVLVSSTFLPERDYVTFGSLLSQFRLSSVCLLSVCRLSKTLVHST